MIGLFLFTIFHVFTLTWPARYAGAMDPNSTNGPSPDWMQPPPLAPQELDDTFPKAINAHSTSRRQKDSKSQPSSLSGSPPMPSSPPPLQNGQQVSQSSGPKPLSYPQTPNQTAHHTTPLSPSQQPSN